MDNMGSQTQDKNMDNNNLMDNMGSQTQDKNMDKNNTIMIKVSKCSLNMTKKNLLQKEQIIYK